MNGLARGKWFCPVTGCGWAAKGRCPRHPDASVYMGKIWRPGKRRSRTRLWDDRVWGRRADARRVTGVFRANNLGPPRTAPRQVLELGGRDRLRAQTGAGWLGVEDPVTWAIQVRARRGKVAR